MKALTKYQANDGTLFDTRAAAEARDALVAECAALGRMLPSPPQSSERLRHDPDTLRAFRAELVALCHRLYPTEPIFSHPPETIHPMSWAGRFLSEAAPTCVNDLWFRLACCAHGFEYDQPYFALHPEEWTGRELQPGITVEES